MVFTIDVSLGDLFTQYINALRADTVLVGLLGGDTQKLSTHPIQSLSENEPEDSVLPYVFLSFSNSDWSTKCSQGFDSIFTNDIWSQKRDPSQAMEITDRIIKVLVQQELTLTAGTNVLMSYQDHNLFLDPDTKTYRSVLLLKALSS